MTQVTLKDGFILEVDEERLDNMELVEALSDLVEADNALALARVAKLALGDEAKKRLYDHFRENGRVPTRAVSDAINEIFTAVGQAKN